MTRSPASPETGWRPPDGSSAVLELNGLSVRTSGGDPIVEDLSLSVQGGEILGVVGESGSGKTTTALALLGYAQSGAEIIAGHLVVGGTRVDLLDDVQSRSHRGSVISYVPQNPGTALNPSMRVGDALGSMCAAHRGDVPTDAALDAALETVHLSGGAAFRRRYPHQLSGGQQQRLCISLALLLEPPVVVLDEPTTGLDVVTQAHILSELRRLRAQQHVSMIYVTHDLAVVAQLADRIAVMYAGRVVEEGPAEAVIRRPRHPYTRALLASIPDHVQARPLSPLPGIAVGVGDWPSGCAFAPRCSLRVARCSERTPELRPILTEGHLARCLRAEEVRSLADQPPASAVAAQPQRRGPPLLEVSHVTAEHRSQAGSVVAAADVSFEVRRGECMALVGESGSGKSTIARVLVGLHPRSAGEIRFGGDLLAALARKRSREERRRIQLIFQNPAESLNPRLTVGFAIGRPARLLRSMSQDAARVEVERLLDLVRLPKRVENRYPAELSGGERQRVAIARALAADPALIVCDEITSALDVSVQAAVVQLLSDLRTELGLAMLFITHDLAVVAAVADNVLVLESGVVRETGAVSEILRRPKDSYTQRLVDSAPSITHALHMWDPAPPDQDSDARSRHPVS